MTRNKFFVGLMCLVGALAPLAVFASESESGGHAVFAITFLFLAIIILASKVGGLIERLGQPPVLGELLAGIVLGNIALLGFNFFEQIKGSELISFLSELGVVILLFQIGLESNLSEMKKVGWKAFLVAVVGVILPFVLGTYFVGPYFFPGQAFNTYLFLGATLTATSVGITARVFKDLKKTDTSEAKIVLGAAVIDDVLGLVILAIVSAVVAVGTVSFVDVSVITLKAVSFLAISIVCGVALAPYIGKIFSRINSGIGMKLGLALSFCLVFAFLAAKAGLAPIVGAFAAGLVLDSVHFKWFRSHSLVDKINKICLTLKDSQAKVAIGKEVEHFQHKHVEELVENLAHFLVPVFFVFTGMQVDITTFFDFKTLVLALVVVVAAFAGKIACGFVAGKDINKWVVGFGMVPRGEVGLIFASVGMGLGVVTPQIYSVIVITVIMTTLIPPFVLTSLLRSSR